MGDVGGMSALESAVALADVARRVFAELDDVDLLMLRATSRTLKRAVREFVGEKRDRGLSRVRLFADRKRLIVDAPPRVDDPADVFWRKVARGELKRWGLGMSTEVMLDMIENPPYGRGDMHVKQRMQYLRERMDCPWDERVPERCLDNVYLSAWKYAIEHGCPYRIRPRKEQTWLTSRGIDPKSYFAKLKQEFSREGERFFEVSIDEATGELVHTGDEEFVEEEPEFCAEELNADLDEILGLLGLDFKTALEEYAAANPEPEEEGEKAFDLSIFKHVDEFK